MSPAKKRSVRRRGSITARPNGTYLARVPLPPDPVTGKRRELTKSFLDIREAQQWQTEQFRLLDEGEHLVTIGGRQRLGDWLTEFYRDHRAGRRGRQLVKLSARTVQIDLDFVRRYVLDAAPALAATPLEQLTPQHFARFFADLSARRTAAGRPIARATVQRVYRLLRARLQYAVKLGKLRRNPCDPDVVLLDGAPKRPQAVLSLEQLQAFLAVCETDRFGAYFATLAWTGMRPGEAAALTWDDVDLAAGVVTVRRALERTKPGDETRGDGTSWQLKATKTGKVRTIPIPPPLVAILRRHQTQQQAHVLWAARAEYEDHGLVFATTFGRPVHLDTLASRHLRPLLPRAAAHLLGRTLPTVEGTPSRAKAYRDQLEARAAAEAAAMRDARFPRVSLYSFRHTQATLLLAQGVPVQVVSERLGHARSSTTLDNYAHVLTGQQAAAVDALHTAVRQAGTTAGAAHERTDEAASG